MIPVAEIFGPTIQGEGPNVGKKCIFVRVSGCDFKCDWCDSKFAWTNNPETKHYTEPDLAVEILNKCILNNTNQVILTGGNPCLYNFNKVIDILHDNDIKVDIETQGSIFPEWLEKVDQIVISPKAPSSKQKDVFDGLSNWLNDIYLKNLKVAIKIPVFNEEDFRFAYKYYNLIKDKWFCKLYLSVGNTDTKESGDISKRVLSDYEQLIKRVCNSDMNDVYILPQVHTLVWGNKQGV